MAVLATASTLQLCGVTAVSGVSFSAVSYEVRTDCFHEFFAQNTDVIVGVLKSQSGTEHVHLNSCQWRLVLLIVVNHV
jgi:hypothetical protein